MRRRETVNPGRVHARVGFLVLLISALCVTGARGECPTNQLGIVDLGDWTVRRFGPFDGIVANWVLSSSNTVVTQTANADASIFLSPFVLQNDQMDGSWRVDDGVDDDFIGFVFGYQDDGHFYLFDWKRAYQNNPPRGQSERGMSVKVFTGTPPLSASELGMTIPANTNRVRLLYTNNIPWAAFTDYQFNLQFQPGQFTITVSQGAAVLANFTINDATYTSGRFGFYNFSEGPVRYAGFTRQILAPRPLITVQPVSVVEGNSGTTGLVFSVNLSSTNCDVTSVDYAINPGSATAGFDYTAIPPGTLIFPPGTTNLLVTVPVIGERVIEPNETLFLMLANVTNGTLGSMQFTGTIINDDTNRPPTVTLTMPGPTPCLMLPTNLLLVADAVDTDGSIVRVQFFDNGVTGAILLGESFGPQFSLVWTNVPAGNHFLTAVAWDDLGARATSAPVAITASFPSALSIDDRTVVEGSGSAAFNVTLFPASCRTVTVAVVTHDGTAIAASDYSGISTTLIFLPGQTLRTVSVLIVGDSFEEPDETFSVCLTNQTAATLERPCGLGTIVNDDTNRPPTVALTVPAAGPCLALPTNILLSADASDPDGMITRVEFFDFATTPLGVTLAPPFEMTWSNVPPGNHLLTAVAFDDYGARATSGPVVLFASALSALSIDDQTVVEGLAGTNAIFTITLDPPSCRTVTVAVATVDGSAVAGADYQALMTSLTFAPGETARTISIPIVGDTLLEPDETFSVCLGQVSNATISRGCGIGTILNDDIACDPNLNATPLANQTRCLCEEVEFSTTVATADPVTYLWKHNGVIIPGETSRTLRLQSLRPSQAGVYTVEVRSPCASVTRSATLTLRGAGSQNPVSFTNAASVTINSSGPASAYPSTIGVECLPGPVKHLAVTIDGLYHSYPDDIDVLLVGPGGQAIKLMSDAGGGQPNRLTNVVLTFTDRATTALPDTTRIEAGIYRATDYVATDAFAPPAPVATTNDLAGFRGAPANGNWSLFVMDDTSGDSGHIARGWNLSIEWADTLPSLSEPQLLADGRFQATLHGLPRMTHLIEGSSDLANWFPVATNTPVSTATTVFDARPGAPAYRFYRAVRCP